LALYLLKANCSAGLFKKLKKKVKTERFLSVYAERLSGRIITQIQVSNSCYKIDFDSLNVFFNFNLFSCTMVLRKNSIDLSFRYVSSKL